MGRIAAVFDRLLSHLGLKAEFYYGKFTEADRSKMAFDAQVFVVTPSGVS